MVGLLFLGVPPESPQKFDMVQIIFCRVKLYFKLLDLISSLGGAEGRMAYNFIIIGMRIAH